METGSLSLSKFFVILVKYFMHWRFPIKNKGCYSDENNYDYDEDAGGNATIKDYRLTRYLKKINNRYVSQ